MIHSPYQIQLHHRLIDPTDNLPHHCLPILLDRWGIHRCCRQHRHYLNQDARLGRYQAHLQTPNSRHRQHLGKHYRCSSVQGIVCQYQNPNRRLIMRRKCQYCS